MAVDSVWVVVEQSTEAPRRSPLEYTVGKNDPSDVLQSGRA